MQKLQTAMKQVIPAQPSAEAQLNEVKARATTSGKAVYVDTEGNFDRALIKSLQPYVSGKSYIARLQGFKKNYMLFVRNKWAEKLAIGKLVNIKTHTNKNGQVKGKVTLSAGCTIYNLPLE